MAGDQCGEGGKVQPRTFTDGLADLSGLPVSMAAFVLRHLQCRARLRALRRSLLFLQMFLCVEANLSLERVSLVLITIKQTSIIVNQ